MVDQHRHRRCRPGAAAGLGDQRHDGVAHHIAHFARRGIARHGDGYRGLGTDARSVSESISSLGRTAASGTAMTDRQSLHVQHVNLRIHVPCSNTPDATRAFEPQSGQALCSFMPRASDSEPSSIEVTRIKWTIATQISATPVDTHG